MTIGLLIASISLERKRERERERERGREREGERERERELLASGEFVVLRILPDQLGITYSYMHTYMHTYTRMHCTYAN